MNHIVVVGASGFIGRHLVQILVSAGYAVEICLHQREAWTDAPPVQRIHHADITVEETLKGIFAEADVVFQLAGATLARTYREFHRVNAVGTENVARACAACPKPPKMVFISSLAALGPTTSEAPLDETAAARPVSCYGRSKYAAEQRLLHWVEHVPIQIVRPPSVMGPEDPYLLDLFRWAARGWVFAPDSAQNRYSFVHVEDLTHALLAIATAGHTMTSADPTRGLYHVSQAPSLSFVELARLVTERLGRCTPRAITVPGWLCWLSGLAGELGDRLTGRRPIVNLDKVREGLAGSWLCDAPKLQQESLYAFPFSLSDRIRQTVDAYRRAGKL